MKARLSVTIVNHVPDGLVLPLVNIQIDMVVRENLLHLSPPSECGCHSLGSPVLLPEAWARVGTGQVVRTDLLTGWARMDQGPAGSV